MLKADVKKKFFNVFFLKPHDGHLYFLVPVVVIRDRRRFHWIFLCKLVSTCDVVKLKLHANKVQLVHGCIRHSTKIVEHRSSCAWSFPTLNYKRLVTCSISQVSRDLNDNAQYCKEGIMWCKAVDITLNRSKSR